MQGKEYLGTSRGTLDFEVNCLKKKSKELQGYSDGNWARSMDDSKSTPSYAFNLRSGIFAWNSKKQEVVAQSFVEAKYDAAASALNQAIC